MVQWPVLVINLDRDLARLEATTAELQRHGQDWQRVAAVDGRVLPSDRVARAYDERRNHRLAKHPMTAPEIGCYLSHMKAWQKLIESGAKGGFIFEDDFRVTGNLKSSLLALTADEGDWDMVKLFSLRPDVSLLRPRPLTAGVEIGEPYRVPTMMLGYALKSAAAEKLIKSAQPFFRPVDEDMKFFWEKGIRVAEIRPSPIDLGLQDSADLTVGQSRRQPGQGGRARSGIWHKLRYRLDYAWRLHTTRLRERLG